MQKFNLYILIIIGFSITSCKKYLDKIPDQKLAIPTVLSDFQQLLDNSNMTGSSAPGVLDLGSDDYYLDYTVYQSQIPAVRNSYTWASDIWEGGISGDWNFLYAIIYRANVVLEGLNNYKIKNEDEQILWNSLYGQALFI